jgi:DNA (cytosine-5)-methyltransferase 1
MTTDLTFAEYFAGIGLVGLGLKDHWRMAFANDIEPKKREMFVAHFGEDPRYVLGDIHALDVDSIPTTILATASFPCIDLSLAGNRAGINGKHSGAFWGFRDILKKMGNRRPPLVLLENVLGWLTANGGRDFRESVMALNQLGYTIDAFVLNAHHFTPQSRPRMFLVGVMRQEPLMEGELLFRFQSRASELRPKRLIDAIWENRDLHWMQLDLPAPPPTRSDVSSIIEELSDRDPRWWSPEKTAHIYSQLSDAHRERIEKLREEDVIAYATVYKRVRNKETRAEIRTDGLAGCLRTPVGGSSKQIVFAVGRGEFRARWMTEREYARLQGADDFVIEVPYLQALFGFGDAVCVPAIQWISEHALVPLAQKLHTDKQKISTPQDGRVYERSYAAPAIGILQEQVL